MRFSIGYNNDKAMLDIVERYKDNIEALYFPIPHRYMGTGRHVSQDKNYVNEVPQLIRRCISLRIRSQLLLNATCEGAGGLDAKIVSKITGYLKTLQQIGLDSVVVTNPVYISEIRRQLPTITIESSVNCYAKTVEEALYLKDLGVDIITIDRDINRNIPLIRQIKERTGLKIKVMVNEGCLRNCPFRRMHYNLIAHRPTGIKEKMTDEFFLERWCMKIFLKNPEKVFNIPFIPPDALKYYIPFVDYFKISSRDNPTSSIEYFLKAYTKEDFNGNLLDLLDSPGLRYFQYIDSAALKRNNFFKRMLTCQNACSKCDYCNILMQEAVVINQDFLQGQERLEEEEKAVRIYKNIIEKSGGKSHLYVNLGKSYHGLGRYKEAIEAGRCALALNHKNIEAYFLLSACLEKIGEVKGARTIYEKALKFFPHTISGYKGLAYACFNLARYKQAIAAARKAMIGDCINDSLLYCLSGSCYAKLKQFKRAVTEFKKAKKINPQDSRIQVFISQCHNTSNRSAGTRKEGRKKTFTLQRLQVPDFQPVTNNFIRR
ncbi:MAG: U32 family peptidase [Candidatus Omnitrophica bacterium]|nr:U32 family peptidase [Candidatus Omnitrophota bacterium]